MPVYAPISSNSILNNTDLGLSQRLPTKLYSTSWSKSRRSCTELDRPPEFSFVCGFLIYYLWVSHWRISLSLSSLICEGSCKRNVPVRDELDFIHKSTFQTVKLYTPVRKWIETVSSFGQYYSSDRISLRAFECGWQQIRKDSVTTQPWRSCLISLVFSVFICKKMIVRFCWVCWK